MLESTILFPIFMPKPIRDLLIFMTGLVRNGLFLFSHPKDFTPVCTTEFGAVAQLTNEWAALNTKVIGLSVDGVEEHKGWKADIESYSGAKPSFPIIADDDLKVSKIFDMLPTDAYMPDGRTVADSASVVSGCRNTSRRRDPRTPVGAH